MQRVLDRLPLLWLLTLAGASVARGSPTMVGHGYSSSPPHSPPPQLKLNVSDERQSSGSIQDQNGVCGFFPCFFVVSSQECALRFDHKEHDVPEFNQIILQWRTPWLSSIIAVAGVALAGLNHKLIRSQMCREAQT